MGTNEICIRVTTFNLPPDQDNAVEFVKSTVGDVTRLMKSQRGYSGGYWGDSPQDRTYGAVLHWSSLQAIEDAREVLEGQLARRAASGFHVRDVRNIQVTAMWREGRRQEGMDGGAARMVERPLQIPARALVHGHPHQVRSKSGSDGSETQTQLRIHYSRLDPADEARGLAYLRDSGADSRARMQAQPGFRLGYAGRVQGSGLIASLTYWSDPEGLAGGEPLMATLASERAAYGIVTESESTLRLFALPAYVKPQMASVG